MTTLDILRTLKADSQLRCIPVIVFFAADPRMILSFYDAHASCVIELPSDFNAYADMLAMAKAFWLGRARLPGETNMLYR